MLMRGSLTYLFVYCYCCCVTLLFWWFILDCCDSFVVCAYDSHFLLRLFSIDARCYTFIRYRWWLICYGADLLWLRLLGWRYSLLGIGIVAIVDCLLLLLIRCDYWSSFILIICWPCCDSFRRCWPSLRWNVCRCPICSVIALWYGILPVVVVEFCPFRPLFFPLLHCYYLVVLLGGMEHCSHSVILHLITYLFYRWADLPAIVRYCWHSFRWYRWGLPVDTAITTTLTIVLRYYGRRYCDCYYSVRALHFRCLPVAMLFNSTKPFLLIYGCCWFHTLICERGISLFLIVIPLYLGCVGILFIYDPPLLVFDKFLIDYRCPIVVGEHLNVQYMFHHLLSVIPWYLHYPSPLLQFLRSDCWLVHLPLFVVCGDTVDLGTIPLRCSLVMLLVRLFCRRWFCCYRCWNCLTYLPVGIVLLPVPVCDHSPSCGGVRYCLLLPIVDFWYSSLRTFVLLHAIVVVTDRLRSSTTGRCSFCSIRLMRPTDDCSLYRSTIRWRGGLLLRWFCNCCWEGWYHAFYTWLLQFGIIRWLFCYIATVVWCPWRFVT